MYTVVGTSPTAGPRLKEETWFRFEMLDYMWKCRTPGDGTTHWGNRGIVLSINS